MGLNLQRHNADIALYFNPRFDQNPNILYLNTVEGGNLGVEEMPSGYDFTYGIRMKVRIYAGMDHFKIFINDKFIYQYKYRRITCRDVKEIKFLYTGDDTAIAAQLVSLQVGYM